MTEELPKITQLPFSVNIPEKPPASEDLEVEETTEGRDFMYQHNGRTLEGRMVPMPVYMRSALMQGRREALGLTLEEVAEQVGVNKSTIQRYESGKIKKIPNDVLDKLEDLYSVSLRESFLDNTNPPERTEQTTPIAIVQEYPASLGQSVRESADTVEHFHYDITVQPWLLEQVPNLAQNIEAIVMTLGRLNTEERKMLYDFVNFLNHEIEERSEDRRLAELMGANKLYMKASPMLNSEQKDELWSFMTTSLRDDYRL